MKPSDEEMRELCRNHTQLELATMLRRHNRTIALWADAAGTAPAYRCQICKQVTPREDCLTASRCKKCDADIRIQNPDRSKSCSKCGEVKSFTEFYIQNKKDYPTLSGACRPCSRAAWEQYHGINVEEVPPIAAKANSIWPAMAESLNGYKGSNGALAYE